MRFFSFFKHKLSSRQKFWVMLSSAALVAYLAAPDDIPEAQHGAIQLQRQGKSSTASSLGDVKSVANENTLKPMEPKNGVSAQPVSQPIDWKLRESFPVQNIDAFSSPMIQTAAPKPQILAPVIVLPPPPKPVAPPLAFEYLGKIGTVHAVQKNDEIYELIPGHIIANDYRVEKVNDTEAILIYVPLNEPQTLALKTKEE